MIDASPPTRPPPSLPPSRPSGAAARWIRGSAAGIAGGIAWRLGLLWIFGPAQSLLADPARQSAKMLAAFGSGADGPRMYAAPWIVWAALLSIGLTWGWWYAWLTPSWRGAWWTRGLRFGALAWTMMIPWFEFYLPWNVLREPASLVALELVCWAGVMLVVGIAISATDAMLVGLAAGREHTTI